MVPQIWGAPAANHSVGTFTYIHTVYDDIPEKGVVTVAVPRIAVEVDTSESEPGDEGG